MYIDKIHDKIKFYLGKSEGKYYNPGTVDIVLHSVSIELYNEKMKLFEKDKIINDDVSPFKKQADLSTTAGKVTKPVDYQHWIGASTLIYNNVTQTATEKAVEIVDSASWNYRLTNPIIGPEPEYPVATFNNTTIEVRPLSVGNLRLYYFKKPTAPKFAYTITNERYVFTESGSVDFEWSETLHEYIIERTLAKFGVNVKDPFLIQYSQAEKAQEVK